MFYPCQLKKVKGQKKPMEHMKLINCCQTKLSWNETLNSINELYFSTCISTELFDDSYSSSHQSSLLWWLTQHNEMDDEIKAITITILMKRKTFCLCGMINH